MIKFLRWVLANHADITPTINWFQPTAWNSGSHSLLGYPWEIFRTTSIIPDTKRPVTFYTKGGGLTKYYSYSIVIPQYDLVVFMGVAGDLTVLNTIFTDVLNPLVTAAETEAQSQLKDAYGGVYKSTEKGLNSSITFTQTEPRSLYISSWISNSTDVMETLVSFVSSAAGTSRELYFQLIPTFKTRHSFLGPNQWLPHALLDSITNQTRSITLGGLCSLLGCCSSSWCPVRLGCGLS